MNPLQGIYSNLSNFSLDSINRPVAIAFVGGTLVGATAIFFSKLRLINKVHQNTVDLQRGLDNTYNSVEIVKNATGDIQNKMETVFADANAKIKQLTGKNTDLVQTNTQLQIENERKDREIFDLGVQVTNLSLRAKNAETTLIVTNIELDRTKNMSSAFQERVQTLSAQVVTQERDQGLLKSLETLHVQVGVLAVAFMSRQPFTPGPLSFTTTGMLVSGK